MQPQRGKCAQAAPAAPLPSPGIYLPGWGGAAPGAAHGERRQKLCGAPPAPQPHAEPRHRRLAAFPEPHAILTPPFLRTGSVGTPPHPPSLPASLPGVRAGVGPGEGGGRAPGSAAPPEHPPAPPPLPCPALPARTPRGSEDTQGSDPSPAVSAGVRHRDPSEPLQQLCP